MKKVKAVVCLGGTMALLLFLGGCCVLFNQKPIADFKFSPTNPLAGNTVTFDASLSYDPDAAEGAELRYEWTFPAGVFKEGKIVTYTFADNGSYDVTLKVTDRFGASDSVTKTVNVLNPPPVISKINVRDLNGCRIEAGDILEFSLEAVDPAALDTKRIVKISWNFGDGTVAEGNVVRHCYPRGCYEYTVVVSVTDDDGASASASTKVYVYPKDGAPTAIIKITPETIFVGTRVTFDGRGSHDNDRICVPCPQPTGDCNELSELCNGCYSRCLPEDRIVSWRWWVKEPCHEWKMLGYGAVINFTPNVSGVWYVKLEVRDDDEDCCNPCDHWVGVITQFEVFSAP